MSKQDDNKDLKKIKCEYNKRYYNKHKKTVLDYLTTKVTCTCGCVISRVNLKKHQKSKKHLKLLTMLKQYQNPIS